MQIIGCDYHPGFQQIAFVETGTGECGERRLEHTDEAEQFYRELHQQRVQVRIGMEASGHGRWFVAGCDRRDGWVGLSLTGGLQASLRVGYGESSNRAKWRALLSARGSGFLESLTPPTLLERAVINSYGKSCSGPDGNADGRRPGSIIGQGVGSRDHASTQGSHSTRPSRGADLCRQ